MAKSGRTEPAFHPAAELFAMITGDQFKALVEDIRENGLLEPIELYEDMILDGRNRYRACLKADVDPVFISVDSKVNAPWHYVISRNLRRRHLTADERKIIAVEAEERIAAETAARKAEQARLQAAEKARDAESGAFKKVNKPDGGQMAPIRQREPRATDEAGALVGVPGRTVRRTKALKKANPEGWEQVKAGKKSIKELTEDVSAVKPPKTPRTKPSKNVPKEKGAKERGVKNEQRAGKLVIQAAGAVHTYLTEQIEKYGDFSAFPTSVLKELSRRAATLIDRVEVIIDFREENEK